MSWTSKHVRSCLCVIPAKGASTRLLDKNLRVLNGRPLVSYPIELAIRSAQFDAVCVSTESQDIAKVAEEYGALVPFTRPDSLARDPATIVDVMLHALGEYDRLGRHYSLIAVMLSTCPFTCMDDVKGALDLFVRSSANAVLGVTQTEFSPFNALIRDESTGIVTSCFEDSPYRATKSTECPTTYRSNGAIAVARREWLESNRSFYGDGVVGWLMPPERSVDIDTNFDLDFAAYLAERALAPPGEEAEVYVP